MRRKGKKLAFGRCHGVEALENRLLLTAAAYTWQDGNIGAGGFLDGVFFDPHNSGVMYARTDIGGLYKTINGGDNWTPLLDFVGNDFGGTSTTGNGTQGGDMQVLGFAMDPQNSNNLYALVGSAVLYSTNAGASWTLGSNFSFTPFSITTLTQTGGVATATTSVANGFQVGTSVKISGATQSGYNGTFSVVSITSSTKFTYAVASGTVSPATGTISVVPAALSVSGNGAARGTGERIAVDPYDSNVVLVGSNVSNGLFESFDAGHTFSQLSSFPLANQITSIVFDPYGGTVGSPTQTILVGLSSNSSGSNLYETTTGGTAWTQVANTGGPASLYPMRETFDSSNDGNVYMTYSDQLPPEGTISTTGAVWRYNLNTSTWGNITPAMPSGAVTSGFVGLGVDAENPGTVVVTTFDHYNGGDFIFRSTTANAATATWVSLFGGDSTRNTTSSPWIAAFTDGIGNWAATAAIDPFNPAHIVYGTGQGLWTTLTGASSATLTAPNSWYFKDYGIDFTAVIGLNAAPSGVPLFSGVGDIDGFAHTTLTSSPAAGAILPGGSIGNMDMLDAAWTNPSFVAAVGTTGNDDGGFSTNNGLSWTEYGAKPSGASGGTVAVTANAAGTGMTIVWSPSSKALFVSNNNGSTWTASTATSGTIATGGKVFADRVTPGDFYYYVTSTGAMWFSSNFGATFTREATTSQTNGAIVVNPFTTGDLWMAAGGGVFHSTNFGATFSRVGPLTSTDSRIALGAPAPGQTVPAIYIRANIGGFLGFDRSDDGGLTWVTINDVNHQWGGYPTFDNGGQFGLMAADPKVFGRVYLATNGRGVIVGNPASSLPAGWTDQDINTPGNPGWATSSTTLSTGTVVNQWTVNGGGAGITGTSDQFNFASESASGSGSLVAKITGMSNADGSAGTPLAGVMYRASNNANDPFAAMLQTAAGSLVFETRATAGGNVLSTTLGSVPVGAEYVEVIRSGNNFSGYYSTNGTNWTQLGSTVAIAAMPATANVGLAASASYNPQLTDAVFSNVVVSAGPSVTQAAAANPNPVTGTSTSLSVAGSENGSGAGLTYTWAATGPASVSYTDNGSATALNTTAMFTAAGSYTFTVTITDASSLSVTSSILVTVNQTLSSAVVAPSSTVIAGGSTVGFTVTGFDQFNAVMNPEPVFAWSTTGGGAFTGASFTASQVGGSYTVHATFGTISPSAAISVVPTIYSGDGLYYIAVSGGTEEIWAGTAGAGSPDYSIAANLLPSLTFNDGNLTVDLSGGDAIPSGGLSFNGIGLNIFDTVGTDSVTLNPTNVTINSDAPITYTQLQTLIFIGGAAPDVITQAATGVAFAIEPTSFDTLNVNVGTFSIPSPGSAFSPYPLAALNVANGASVVMQTALPAPVVDHTVLILGSLSIAGTGKLDLGGNDMIVHGGDLPTLSNDIGQGSILSSIAAATNNQAVGIAVNLASSFDGQNVQSTDVLVKYTYYGDADLSGNVTAADYLLIDNGFNSQSTIGALSGWQNGDFNYDGRINGDDYTLIDNAFNTQNTAQPLVQAQPLAVATPSPLHQPNLFSSTSTVPFADSDDTLLKRRHHRESLVQSIKQLND